MFDWVQVQQATQTGASQAGTTGASKVFAGNPDIAKKMGVDGMLHKQHQKVLKV